MVYPSFAVEKEHLCCRERVKNLTQTGQEEEEGFALPQVTCDCVSLSFEVSVGGDPAGTGLAAGAL